MNKRTWVDNFKKQYEVSGLINDLMDAIGTCIQSSAETVSREKDYYDGGYEENLVYIALYEMVIENMSPYTDEDIEHNLYDGVENAVYFWLPEDWTDTKEERDKMIEAMVQVIMDDNNPITEPADAARYLGFCD